MVIELVDPLEAALERAAGLRSRVSIRVAGVGERRDHRVELVDELANLVVAPGAGTGERKSPCADVAHALEQARDRAA